MTPATKVDAVEAARAAHAQAFADAEAKIARARELVEVEEAEANAEAERRAAIEREKAEAEARERAEQEARVAERQRIQREAEEAARIAEQTRIAMVRAAVEHSKPGRTLVERARKAYQERPADDDVIGQAAQRTEQVLGVRVPEDLWEQYDAGAAQAYFMGERLLFNFHQDGSGTAHLSVDVRRPTGSGDTVGSLGIYPIEQLGDVGAIATKHQVHDLFQREEPADAI